MRTLTTETEMEPPREIQPTKPRKPKQIKQESKEKTPFSVKLLIAGLVILIILVSALYSFEIVKGNQRVQAVYHMMGTIEAKNDNLRQKINALEAEIEEQANTIDVLEQENQRLNKELRIAKMTVNDPWLNGTVLSVFAIPTDINQIVTPIVIDFPEDMLYNTTVIQGETTNITILWTSKEITSFEGEVRYNFTRLPNPDVPSLHMLFSKYQAPEEAEPYLRKTSEFTWTDEELNGLVALIDVNDTLKQVLIKTLDYANEIKEPSPNPCAMASLKATGLLRAMGIPTRMVAGFLATYSRELIKSGSGHGWVQVYLDGYWLDYNAGPWSPSINNFINEEIINYKTTYEQLITEFKGFSAKTIVRGGIYSRMISKNQFEIIRKYKYPSEDTT